MDKTGVRVTIKMVDGFYSDTVNFGFGLTEEQISLWLDLANSTTDLMAGLSLNLSQPTKVMLKLSNKVLERLTTHQIAANARI